MSSKNKAGLARSLLAPFSGRAIPLEQVPDDVFSRKLLGDGAAIIPADGRLCAPADGVVSMIAETLHAYVFTSGDGLEILVHVGLDSAALGGEGFTPRVKQGDRVRAGQLVAEIDLKLLERRGVPNVVPILICEGAEDVTMNTVTGNVTAGEDAVILLDRRF